MTNTMVYKNNQLQGGNPFTMIYNPITTDYNGDYNDLQLFTMIDNQLQPTTMAITMIDNQLQSIYNHLQSNYNRLQWGLQGFTINYNQFTINYNSFTMIYNRLQW